MAVFNSHKLKLAELFRVIPEELFEKTAKETRVDSCTGVLHGKMLFYLSPYALPMDDKPG
jgi:hypothetical protein